MKKTILFLAVFAFTAVSAFGQGAIYKNSATGSEWKSSYIKAKTRHYAIDTVIGLHQIITTEKFKRIILNETAVNPKTFSNRRITLENVLTGEEFFSQKLENGVMNTVTIDLGILKAKYPNTKELGKQVFIIREYADDVRDDFIPMFVFELK